MVFHWFQKAYWKSNEIFLMHKNHLKYLFISTYHTSTERNSMDKSNFWPWDRNFEISKFAWTCSLTIFYCYRIIVRDMFISRVIALCHGTYQTIIWLFRVCECACVIHFATPLIISYAQRHTTRIWSSQFKWKMENWSEKANSRTRFHSECGRVWHSFWCSFFMWRCNTGCISLEKNCPIGFSIRF